MRVTATVAARKYRLKCLLLIGGRFFDISKWGTKLISLLRPRHRSPRQTRHGAPKQRLATKQQYGNQDSGDVEEELRW